jgi:hypothetical protein
MDRQYVGIDFHRRRSVIVGLSAAGEKALERPDRQRPGRHRGGGGGGRPGS